VSFKFQILSFNSDRSPRVAEELRARNQQLRQAFSLAELLVSTAVLSILMLLLFGLLEQATRAWQASEKKVDAFREARAALYLLKRDLEGLLVNDSVPFFRFDDPVALSPLLYSGPTLNTPAKHGDALFFISHQSGDAQDSSKAKSDLCAIGYYLVYDRDSTNKLTGSTPKSYRLLRYFKSSDETWAQPTQTAPRSGLRLFLSSVGAGSPDYTQLFAPAQGNSTGDEVVARNVINFQALPLDVSHQPLVVSTGSRFHIQPVFFEISLTALNLETAHKLTTQNDWHKSPPDYDKSALFKQNAQEFKLRVTLIR
jgi:uncharacterized protein (TIGR02599 family)